MRRVVFCWQGISGYMAACWRALSEDLHGAVSVLSVPSTKFDPAIMNGIDFHMMSLSESRDAGFVERWVEGKTPSVVVVGGWSVPVFKALAGCTSLRAVPFVLGFDTPWTGGVKQWLAPCVLQRYIRRFSCVVVPGERGRQFAQWVVPRNIPIETGLYGFATESLSKAAELRMASGGWPKRFLFIGRYAKEKGIDVLVDAYVAYRQRHVDPWPLTVCGRGSLANLFADVPGISDEGFVSPEKQPALMALHGAFVLASVHEPWGVVIGEAAAAGMPIICTDSCGASVELVRQDYNGFVVPAGSRQRLSMSLGLAHAQYLRLPEMGRRSQHLAAPYAAFAWAEHWKELLVRVGPPATPAHRITK